MAVVQWCLELGISLLDAFGMVSRIPISLPRLFISLVFCLSLLLASLCNFRISKLAWNRGPAAEGFIYIPTTDINDLERILWERFPVVCGNGSEVSVPGGEDVSVMISLLFYSFSCLPLVRILVFVYRLCRGFVSCFPFLLLASLCRCRSWLERLPLDYRKESNGVGSSGNRTVDPWRFVHAFLP